MGILLISQFWTLANDDLRRTSGQAAVRLHRRRRQPGGRSPARRSLTFSTTDVRHEQPPAGERRPARGRRRAGAEHRGAQSRPARVHRQGRRGEGRRRQRGACECCASRGTCRSSRWSSPSRAIGAYIDRAAAEHGGRGVQGPRRRRQPDRVPRQVQLYTSVAGFLDPGAAHQPHPPVSSASASRC